MVHGETRGVLQQVLQCEYILPFGPTVLEKAKSQVSLFWLRLYHYLFRWINETNLRLELFYEQKVL